MWSKPSILRRCTFACTSACSHEEVYTVYMTGVYTAYVMWTHACSDEGNHWCLHSPTGIKVTTGKLHLHVSATYHSWFFRVL